MKWNYRITSEKTKDDEVWYSLREIFYRDDDPSEPIAWTDRPCTFGGDSPDEVRQALMRALEASTDTVLDLDALDTDKDERGDKGDCA